jgi:nuclear pore complex protein Nup62
LPPQVPPSTPKAADNQATFTLTAQPAIQPLAQAPKPAENQVAVNQLLTNQNYPFQNDTVETIIKKWKEELAGDIQRFKIQANRVSVWENQLHENFKNAQQLRQNIEKVDLYFEEIEKGCTEVETWQDELDNELEQIERNLNAHINQSDEEPNEDDIEREDILHEGENLDKYLQDMEAKLDKIMRDFNIARSEVGEDSSNNPIANIMQILNSHHNNLAWLDSKTKLLYAEINSLRD